MVAGAVAHQHDVVVIVDDAGYHGAAAQIDDAGSGAGRASGAVDGREAAVADRYRVRHGVVAIHRVDPAVDEDEFLVGSTGSTAVGNLRCDDERSRPAERRCERGGAGSKQLAA